jgi:hypothetical protein
MAAGMILFHVVLPELARCRLVLVFGAAMMLRARNMLMMSEHHDDAHSEECDREHRQNELIHGVILF